MNKEIINIIIPSYKPKEYLYECLNSIELQKVEKFEYCIYIILNGEKEPYYSNIKNYIKNKNLYNINLYYIEEKGVSKARNEALNLIKEGYILFLDDDDLLSENFLEYCSKNKKKDTILISNTLCFDEFGAKSLDYLGKNFIKYKNLEKKILNIRKQFSNVCGKLYPIEMIKNIRFDEKLKNGEDSLFSTKISKNFEKISFTDENIYYKRRLRPNSASRKKRDINNFLKNEMYLLKEYLKILLSKDYNKIFVITRILALFKNIILHIKFLYKIKQ